MFNKNFLAAVMVIFFATAAMGQNLQPLTLMPGFNFISFTVSLNNFTAAQLKSLNPAIDDIYLFNSSAGGFLSANNGELSLLGAGKGYIIKSSSNSDIALPVNGGNFSGSGNISLKAGFNLIGFSRAPETLKFSDLMRKSPKIRGVYKWSYQAGSFLQVLRSGENIVQLDGVDPQVIAGQSYFIYMDSDASLNYDGSAVIFDGDFQERTSATQELLKLVSLSPENRMVEGESDTAHGSRKIRGSASRGYTLLIKQNEYI